VWTWERERRRQAAEPAAQLGTVTVGGGEPAVNLGGERRWLQVCAPGGYGWTPRQGDRVLVLKDGQQAWVLGLQQQGEAVKPGQVKLTGENCALLLGERVELTGEVALNGRRLEDHIRSIVAEMLSGG